MCRLRCASQPSFASSRDTSRCLGRWTQVAQTLLRRGRDFDQQIRRYGRDGLNNINKSENPLAPYPQFRSNYQSQPRDKHFCMTGGPFPKANEMRREQCTGSGPRLGWQVPCRSQRSCPQDPHCLDPGSRDEFLATARWQLKTSDHQIKPDTECCSGLFALWPVNIFNTRSNTMSMGWLW